MKFGTKLKLRKDWKVGIIDFEVGDIFYVANYIHNQGIKLKHNGVKNLIDFNFTSQVRDKKIDEYFEVLSADSELIEEYKQMMFDRNTEAQNMVSELRLKIDELKENDRLAELEEYCLGRDLNISITWQKINDWNIEVYKGYGKTYEKIFYTDGNTTKKEAIREALEFFKIGQYNEVEVE